nr:conjugal transfer transcriptional regulator TraJ [uncultured bacterium]
MREEKKQTRKGNSPIKVYCLPEERAQIEANAKAAGMSLSSYLLAVGQGYKIQGVVDFEQVKELAKINGDLGRLGGLLKLWLTDDVRTARFGVDTITAVLDRVMQTQAEMSAVMTKVVMPRSGKL